MTNTKPKKQDQKREKEKGKNGEEDAVDPGGWVEINNIKCIPQHNQSHSGSRINTLNPRQSQLRKIVTNKQTKTIESKTKHSNT